MPTNPKRSRRKSKSDFGFYKNQNSRIRHAKIRNLNFKTRSEK